MISIIIPVYNSENTLRMCLDSIVNQTYRDFEVCLVVNGCSDSSEVICREYANLDKRFRVLYSDRGASKARNYGIKQSKGDYIAFVDSDDFICNRHFEFLYNAIKENQCQMAVCGYNVVDSKLNQKKTCVINDNYKRLNYEEQIEAMYYNDLLNPLWNKLYKKNMIIDYMNPAFKIGEDLDFNLKFLKRYPSIAYVPQTSYVYIACEDSYKKKYFDNRFQTLKKLQINLIELLLRYDSTFVLCNKPRLVEKVQKDLIFCFNENVRLFGLDSIELNKKLLMDEYVKKIFSINVRGKKNEVIRRIILTGDSKLVYLVFNMWNLVALREKRK